MAVIHGYHIDELQFLTRVTTRCRMSDSQFANLLRDAMPSSAAASVRRRRSGQVPFTVDMAAGNITVRSVGAARWEMQTYVEPQMLVSGPKQAYASVYSIWAEVLPSMPIVEEVQTSTHTVAICVDFTGAQFGRASCKAIRTRRKATPTPNGFRFGKDLIYYDKSDEILRKPKKAWILPYREAAGYSQADCGPLQRLEWCWRGRRLQRSPFPDLTAMLHSGLEDFPHLRAGYGRRTPVASPLWRQIRESVRIAAPWDNDAPPGFCRRPTMDQTMRQARGMLRWAAATLSTGLIEMPQTPKELLVALAELHFAHDTEERQRFMDEVRRRRLRLGQAINPPDEPEIPLPA